MSPLLVADHMPDLWLPPVTTAQYRPLRRETTLRPLVVPFEQSCGRFDHLDLDFYRQTMSARDFNFFLTFAGGDTLGFTDEDLEVFYPPEE